MYGYFIVTATLVNSEIEVQAVASSNRLVGDMQRLGLVLIYRRQSESYCW